MQLEERESRYVPHLSPYEHILKYIPFPVNCESIGKIKWNPNFIWNFLSIGKNYKNKKRQTIWDPKTLAGILTLASSDNMILEVLNQKLLLVKYFARKYNAHHNHTLDQDWCQEQRGIFNDIECIKFWIFTSSSNYWHIWNHHPKLSS